MDTPLQSAHQVEFRIFAEDTDYMAIVYHANYLRFFERARTELLRTLGFSLTSFEKQGIHFAIHQANLNYCLPARLDDMVTITSRFTKKGRTSLKFDQVMCNQNKKKLCEAEIQVVCLDTDFKPRKLPMCFTGGQAHE